MTQATQDKINAATARKWAKKNRKEAKPNPVQEIKSSLLEISEGNKSLTSLPIWSQIMEVADSKGHFATDIIEKAMSGKSISDKQAWVVGKFAAENNIK